METKSPQDVVEKPELHKILEALNVETNITDSLTIDISYKCNILKQFRIQDSEANVKQQEPNDIIEQLWSEIWKLRKSNDELKQINKHLQSIIGC